MKKTTLALATAALLGGLTLGVGSASAATQDGVRTGAAPTTYVMMHKKKMMMRHKMMHRKMMMKKKMM